MVDSQPSSSSDAADKPQPTGFIPGDDLWTQFRNVYAGITGKMTPEGVQQFRLARDIRNEEEDCKRCESDRDYLLNYSPIIKFLQNNITQLGGDISAKNIHCRRCTTDRSGGFDPEYGIQLCSNIMTSRSHTEDTLAHEMIHAYDHLRFKLDWVDNLKHAACAEIRASSLSGECRWSREFFGNKQFNLTRHHQACVRRRAILSVQARPNCKDKEQAARVVDDVWQSCFRDTRPFDEIYR
ncbi:Mitochondrial inner membrane protease atp23 [Myotisia sp. PD_48]|nr:Mitochondrial inner membrane protease atp23 [Myotisia sp. PD_48]